MQPSSAGATEIVDRLAALPDLAEIPRDQLQWLVEHGEIRRLADGEAIHGSDGFTPLIVVVAGHFSVRVKEHGVERELREVPAGRISGFLPYSRMTTPRGYLVAVGPTEILEIRQEDLRDMTRACYEFTGACVQEMLARARVFKADDKRLEKMAALGRLSAGLAHELNNPASALLRGAGALEACRRDVAAAARALGAAGLDAAAESALGALEAAARRTGAAPLTPVGRADLEDRLAGWLERRGLDGALGYPLAEAGLALEDLDAAAGALAPAVLPAVVAYVAASAAARALEASLLSGATRIHTTVAAVQKHTHMDRAPVAEAIALEDHLADTVTLLRARASLKGVSLELVAEAGLPQVTGSVADLNQVWMHLIDNAVDAAPPSGRITVEAACDRDSVVVRVVDDGPGIPEENRERVFEPFFTTKDVGEGRGLGLDVVRTVVGAHRGTVGLTSRPGRTEFRVTLPAAAPAGDGVRTGGAARP